MIKSVEDLRNKYVEKSNAKLFNMWFDLVKDVALKDKRDKSWFSNPYATLELGPLGFYVNAIDGMWLDGKQEIFINDIAALHKEKFPEQYETEWKNGDECVCKGQWAIVIGMHPQHPLVVVDTNDGFEAVGLDDLSKPEPPERREFIETIGDILECKEYEIELGRAYDAGYRLSKLSV